MSSNIKVVCNEPKIYIIDNFISDQECNHLINLTEGRLKKAGVTGNGKIVNSSSRTNRNCWINHNNDIVTTNLCNRVSKLVKLPIERSENLQLLHYAQTEKYDYHLDGFPINNSQKSKTFLNLGGQRILTVLGYLNDVEEGGGTGFKRLNLEVSAKKGRIVVFENCYPNSNEPHQRSLHAGLPVIKGNKYAFNLWFREINAKEEYNRDLIKPYINTKIKTGIISTIGKPYYLETWLNYHFNKILIDKIIIFYDKKNFPESKELFNNIKSKYPNLIILDSNNNSNLIQKQKLNVNQGINEAKKHNIDFIFHIDDDELLYIKNNNLQNILKEYKDKKEALHFENLEVFKTFNTIKKYNFFENEHYFKKRGCGLYKSYYNGKAGGFVENVKWNGPHSLKTKDNTSTSEDRIKVLHYPFLIFEQWVNKYNIIDKVNKLNFPFHNKSAELIRNYRDKKIEFKDLALGYMTLLNDNNKIQDIINQDKIIYINLGLN